MSHRTASACLVIFFITTICAPTAAHAAAPGAAGPHPPSSAVPDTGVIASVGPWTITARDLLDSYEFGPAFVKRAHAPLAKHLEFMIYERMLAADALRSGADTTAFVRERLAGLEEDAAVDQLYLDDVLAHAALTNAEIDDGMRKAMVTVRLRWIVTRTQQRADSLYAAYRAGATIDERLYARNDSGGVNVMETTLLKLAHDNPAIARQIVPLKRGQLSAPLRESDGYYLFRVDAVERRPLATASDEEAARDEAIRLLREAKADSIAGPYVQRLMRLNAPVIKAEGYNIVRAYLGAKGLSQDKKLEWNVPSTFMTEAGPVPIAQAGKFLQRPLVTYGRKQLTVGDYLRWFDIRQFQLKTSTLEAFNHSVRQTIWKMTQDRLLSEEAYARGLQKRDTVRYETGKWNAKLLYIASRASMMRGAKVNEAQVRKEYEARKRLLTDAKGKQLAYEEARAALRGELMERAAHATLVRTLERLKKEIPVRVDSQRLGTLESSVERDAHPIEILYYKPGGTFPRVAFPTIDIDWQDY